MIATTLLLAASVVGVQTGWQPHEEGGLEYIIQIEPELLSVLREGEALTSEIPAHIDGVRRYRIVVGKNVLPRVGAQDPPPAAQSNPTPPVQTPAFQPEVELPAEAAFPTSPPLSASDDYPPVQEPLAPAQEIQAQAPGEESLPPAQETLTPTQESFTPSAEEPAAEESSEPSMQPVPRYQFPSFDPPPLQPQTEPAGPVVQETEPPLLKETEADALQTAYKQAQTALENVSLEDEAEAALPATAGPPTWIGWTLALLTLAASLGANCFLGWMWIDTRRRYQTLVYDRTAA